jgi:hypothetical protein
MLLVDFTCNLKFMICNYEYYIFSYDCFLFRFVLYHFIFLNSFLTLVEIFSVLSFGIGLYNFNYPVGLQPLVWRFVFLVLQCKHIFVSLFEELNRISILLTNLFQNIILIYVCVCCERCPSSSV